MDLATVVYGGRLRLEPGSYAVGSAVRGCGHATPRDGDHHVNWPGIRTHIGISDSSVRCGVDVERRG